MSDKRIVVTERDRARLTELAEGLAGTRDESLRECLEDLSRKLEKAEKVDPSGVSPDVVTMNTRVRVTDLDSGDSAVYTIAWPGQADPAEMRVSVFAPIGQALLGARVGAEVRVRVPAGQRRLRIDKIVYQPEAAGDQETLWSSPHAAPPPSRSIAGFHT